MNLMDLANQVKILKVNLEVKKNELTKIEKEIEEQLKSLKMNREDIGKAYKKINLEIKKLFNDRDKLSEKVMAVLNNIEE